MTFDISIGGNQISWNSLNDRSSNFLELHQLRKSAAWFLDTVPEGQCEALALHANVDCWRDVIINTRLTDFSYFLIKCFASGVCGIFTNICQSKIKYECMNDFLICLTGKSSHLLFTSSLNVWLAWQNHTRLLNKFSLFPIGYCCLVKIRILQCFLSFCNAELIFF